VQALYLATIHNTLWENAQEIGFSIGRKVKTNMIKFAFALTLIILAVTFGLVDRDRDIPDPVFLSQDLFFQIGGDVISAPVVAVRDVSTPPNNNNPLPGFRTNAMLWGTDRSFANNKFKTAMINFAGDAARPANVSSIELSITVYGSYGEYAISRNICSILTKTWSQKVCRNEFPDAVKNIPRRFRLSTEDGLSRYQHTSFSGVLNVSGSDLLEVISPLNTQTKTACTDGQEFCISALAVSNDVYATWLTVCRQLTDESCERANIAKGNAIREFLQNHLMVK